MKLVHELINEVINLDNEEKVNTLIIENQSFFTKILIDFYNQLNNETGEFVLSRDNIPIDIARNLEIIIDFIDFKINKKDLLNKLMKYIDFIATDDNMLMKTNEMKTLINNFAFEISENIEFDVDFTLDYDISYILKAINFKFKEDYTNLSEKLIEYMLLIRKFDNDKCFVLVNIRNYIKDSEIDEFYKTILYNKLKVLVISAKEYPTSDYELKIIIDKDLCEF